MTCSYCSFDFDAAAAELACAGCPSVAGGCRGVRCPRCGYDAPAEPRLLSRLRSLFRRAETAAPSGGSVPLDQLAPGQAGTVERLDGADPGGARKLIALGVLPGTPVVLERRGAGVVFRAGRTQLGVDAALAKSVVVRVAAVALALVAWSRTAAADKPIQDNSFLIEEAYNQEPGVIQHISTFTRDLRGSGAWAYTFTEEWPFLSQTHQVSATLAAHGSPADLDDVLLNYRLQLTKPTARVAIAPRVSAVLPAGGEGGAAAQLNLPVSVELLPLVAHLNAGVTVPVDGTEATGFGGGSLIWLAHHRVNLMVEVAGSGGALDSLYLSPGLRVAVDIGGLQIVPGLAVPLGVGPSAGERAVFAYLSFEHSLD